MPFLRQTWLLMGSNALALCQPCFFLPFSQQECIPWGLQVEKTPAIKWDHSFLAYIPVASRHNLVPRVYIPLDQWLESESSGFMSVPLCNETEIRFGWNASGQGTSGISLK